MYYTISGNMLTNGVSMAELSGDYNSSGQVEIWPQLLELAWAHLGAHNGYQSIIAGTAGAAWTALTGLPGFYKSCAGKTNDQILETIAIDLTYGQVAVATLPKSNGVGPLTLARGNIYFDHAYIVQEVDNVHKTITLINPWGVSSKDDHKIIVPFDDFAKAFAGIFDLF